MTEVPDLIQHAQVQDPASPDAATEPAAVEAVLSTGASPGCFRGQHIVFWLSAHTAILKTKAVLAGAILEDSISAKTSLVVADKNTSAAEAVAHLTQLPAGLPLRSKKYQGHKLKLPNNINFTVPQYISDCLAKDRLLSAAPYQITLQQVAAQDTRSYSEESGSDAEAQSPPQSTAVQSELHLQPLTAPDDADSILHSPEQAPSIDEAPLPPNKKHKVSAAAEEPSQKQPTNASSKQLTEKRIGIYPDVDPKQRNFTGGNTGIVWGTGPLKHGQLLACI